MANKSGIHIKEKNKGSFTKKAKAAGMSVQAFAKHVKAHPDNYSGHTRQQANFARVAKTKFKHQAGGSTGVTIGGTLGNPETLEVPNLYQLPPNTSYSPKYTSIPKGANASDSAYYNYGFQQGVGPNRLFNYEHLYPGYRSGASNDEFDKYAYSGMQEALNPHGLKGVVFLPKDVNKHQAGGQPVPLGPAYRFAPGYQPTPADSALYLQNYNQALAAGDYKRDYPVNAFVRDFMGAGPAAEYKRIKRGEHPGITPTTNGYGDPRLKSDLDSETNRFNAWQDVFEPQVVPKVNAKATLYLPPDVTRHQTGGYQPQIVNTNPGMQPIQFKGPANPTFDFANNITPYAEPMDQMMPQNQQQQRRYRTSNGKYVDAFNGIASVATAVGDVIQQGKRNHAERLRLIEGMTPRYMQNMEGSGLDNGPAYTMYGGRSDMATSYTGNMHGEGTTVGIRSKSAGPNFRQYSRGIDSDTADGRTESDVPQPYPIKPGKMPVRYMMGGPSQRAMGWDYDDHVIYMMYGGADFGVPKDYSDMDNEDFGYAGIGHNGPWGQRSVYRAGGDVTADKAKEILHDGTIHGKPITDKQRRYFGWIAGGKKQYGGWDQKGFMMQNGGGTEDYYRANAQLAYFKDKLNDKLKAKNPQAYGDYFKGLVGARKAGNQQAASDYVQNTQYNEYLTPDEIKKTLGNDYDKYLNSLKAVNTYNVSQGQQPLYGTQEGQQSNSDPSQLNYGRRFASLQVTPSFAKTLNGATSKTYGRNYQYNPKTGNVDFTETGDVSLRPEGFSAPATPTVASDSSAVTSRKYGGRKYQAGGRSFMTGPAMQAGGEGYAVGDEIEMSAIQIAALKKQGYKFEEC